MASWIARVLFISLLLMMSGLIPASAMSLKIMCISDYQGDGKQEVLKRLSAQVIAEEGGIDALIIAGDYISSEEIFTLFNQKYDLGSSPGKMDIFIAPGNHDLSDLDGK